MQANVFYQTHSQEKAIALHLINAAQWEANDTHLTSYERNQLVSQQFKGKVGDVAMLADEWGVFTKAYIGVGCDCYVLSMAQAALRLPPGLYALQQELTPYAYVIWALAQYRFDSFKSHDNQPRVLMMETANYQTILREVEAIFLVRDLINQPPNQLGPKELGTAMANVALHYGADFQQTIGEHLLENNFPAIHMVGRSSINAPRLLELYWGNPSHPKITLIGKGVCFDSGGLDIKPSAGMRFMKKDMGGAAHALGLAQWIMASGLPVRLQVLIPAVENSIGPDAFRPGDIISMRNGVTVEIDNTDAEGRLVLADACVLAGESNPDLIINFATLTGAARVAVGTEIAAMFTNNEALAHELSLASENTDDPIWRLPLFKAYESLLESSVADIANASSSPYAGAITAALFLQRFMPVGVPFVHFDIMAWNVSSKPGKPEGGEAMGLRAIMAYLNGKYHH